MDPPTYPFEETSFMNGLLHSSGYLSRPHKIVKISQLICSLLMIRFKWTGRFYQLCGLLRKTELYNVIWLLMPNPSDRRNTNNKEYCYFSAFSIKIILLVWHFLKIGDKAETIKKSGRSQWTIELPLILKVWFNDWHWTTMGAD